MLSNFSCVLSSADIVFEIIFFEKKNYQKCHQSVVGPGLGSNCLQISADDNRKQRVKVGVVFRLVNRLAILQTVEIIVCVFLNQHIILRRKYPL